MKFKVEEMMKNKQMSRYRLEKITGWNHGRVNAYYKGKVKSMKVVELEAMCNIFDCELSDLIEVEKGRNLEDILNKK